jgi:hypothetical protein
MGKLVKENAKSKKFITQSSIHEIWDTMKRTNLRMIGKAEDFQVKGPGNIFNEIIKENFRNLKKEIPIKVQKAHRTPNQLHHKKILLPHDNKKINVQNVERIATTL